MLSAIPNPVTSAIANLAPLIPTRRTTLTKPLFEVDIAPSGQVPLEALLPLSGVDESACHHTSQNLRMPIGIYNVSVSRVCDKVIRLCRRLESYFASSVTVNPSREPDDMMIEVIDYLELSLYAAAEHVDDVDSIASGFFRSKLLRDKDVAYRNLVKKMKGHKRLVAAAANAIKHQQSRVRLCSMDYSHAGKFGCLHGYFFEAVENGVICPSIAFHQNQAVFSITTLVWEILTFLLNSSRDLAEFLSRTAPRPGGPVHSDGDIFRKAVVAAARLPLYTFGEEHPFSRVTLRIMASAADDDSLSSGLYGSIREGWLNGVQPTFGNFVARFAGDGCTKKFRFPQPKAIGFQHWT